MRSMTAYACIEKNEDNIFISMEIKSYNNRFLEIQIHMPGYLLSYEGSIRKYISSRFTRGKIDVYIKVKNPNEELSVIVNKNAALSYQNAIGELSVILGLNEKAGLEMLLGLDGVLNTETARDASKYKTIIDTLLEEASNILDEEKKREGEFTKKDILGHLAVLEESLEKIKTKIPEMEAAIKENLRSRFFELLGDKIDETRILAETASQLVKYSISEEISRLSSHLEEFKNEAKNNMYPGKKLDFLSQEINREINTIGSKTPVLDVSRAVVAMKNALEDIREQLRNVE